MFIVSFITSQRRARKVKNVRIHSRLLIAVPFLRTLVIGSLTKDKVRTTKVSPKSSQIFRRRELVLLVSSREIQLFWPVLCWILSNRPGISGVRMGL